MATNQARIRLMSDIGVSPEGFLLCFGIPTPAVCVIFMLPLLLAKTDHL